MHIRQEPFTEIFIDWMGFIYEIDNNLFTDQVFEAYFFVTTLDYSDYPLLEVFTNHT